MKGLSPKGGSKAYYLRMLLLFAHSFLYSYSYGYGHTNHRVVTSTDEAHHVNVCRYGGGTCELGIAVHTAHGVGHTIGSRASSHVVRMERTARAATGSNGEVLLAVFDAVFLVAACNRMLEAGRVRGVTGDGDVNVLQFHDGNAFLYGFSTVAANLGAEAIAVSDFLHYVYFVSLEVVFGFYEGETVDAADDLSSVFAEAVQDNAQGVLTNFVSRLCDTDSTFSSCEGFVTSQECEAASFFGQPGGLRR